MFEVLVILVVVQGILLLGLVAFDFLHYLRVRKLYQYMKDAE